MKNNTIVSPKTRHSVRSLFISSLFCGILFFSLPQINFAYDNDTHFWLTYYLARKADYTDIQATQIASANVSVDYDPDTEPVLAKVNHWRDFYQPIAHFQNVVETFHALPNKSEVNIMANIAKPDDYSWDPTVETKGNIQEKADELVRQRKDGFWKKTLAGKTNPGVFLHYEQDIYAHRKFKGWLGHGGYYYVDFLSSNPPEAERMAFNTLKYLIIFRKSLAEKNLDPKFRETKVVDNLDENYFVTTNDISQEAITEIRQTVWKFIKENSPHTNPLEFDGTEKFIETPIVDKWEKFSAKKQKEQHKLIPFTYIPDLWRNKSKQPVPNSYKARLIVKKVLNIKDADLPHIWRYNLHNRYDKNDLNNTDEYLEETFANQAYVYKTNYEESLDNKKVCYLIKDEKANKKLTKMCMSNQRFDLPFALLNTEPFDIRPCKQNR